MGVGRSHLKEQYLRHQHNSIISVNYQQHQTVKHKLKVIRNKTLFVIIYLMELLKMFDIILFHYQWARFRIFINKNFKSKIMHWIRFIYLVINHYNYYRHYFLIIHWSLRSFLEWMGLKL